MEQSTFELNGRVKWNNLSIRFFIKYVNPSIVGLRIFVYHDIKKWYIEVNCTVLL